MITSYGSSFILGGISSDCGDALFKSTFFNGGKDSQSNNTMITTEIPSPPIFLRVKVPIDRLVLLQGGDTVASSDVPTLGDKEKPGFIPVTWVDRISWIVDSKKLTPDMLRQVRESNGLNYDVRQYPSITQLKAGLKFSDTIVEALEKLNTVDWIRKIMPKDNI